jgi:hypothetical protein
MLLFSPRLADAVTVSRNAAPTSTSTSPSVDVSAVSITTRVMSRDHTTALVPARAPGRAPAPARAPASTSTSATVSAIPPVALHVRVYEFDKCAIVYFQKAHEQSLMKQISYPNDSDFSRDRDSDSDELVENE